MRTTDFMSERDLQDLRDAGRGHLIDGGRAAALIDKADELRKREREEPSVSPQADGAKDSEANSNV